MENTQLSKKLQSIYDRWIHSLDLSSIDPPNAHSSWRIFACYTRTFIVHDTTLTLRIARIRSTDGSGPTHALLPWFLLPFAQITLIECFMILQESLFLSEDNQTDNVCDGHFKFPADCPSRLRARFRLFGCLFQDPQATLVDWIHLSFSRFKRNWLQVVRTVKGRTLTNSFVL